MRKPGDIEMIFGNPNKMDFPIGQAKLLEKVGDVNGKFEEWWVEYLDSPDHKYISLLKAPDNGKIEKDK